MLLITASMAAVLHFSGTRGGSAFDVSDYSYAVRRDGVPAIELALHRKEDITLLEALSRDNLGAHISVTIDGKSSYLPIVRRVLNGPRFEISFNDPSTFDAIRSSLEVKAATPEKATTKH